MYIKITEDTDILCDIRNWTYTIKKEISYSHEVRSTNQLFERNNNLAQKAGFINKLLFQVPYL